MLMFIYQFYCILVYKIEQKDDWCPWIKSITELRRPPEDRLKHGLINYKDTNAKCHHLRKFSAGVYLSEPPPLLRPRSPPPPYTLYTCIQYTYSHRERGEVGEITREKDTGSTVHKAGRKYHYSWLYLQSINSDIHGSLYRWLVNSLISREDHAFCCCSCWLIQATPLPAIKKKKE